MAANSSNDVAAKIIGAQLQSLLKIPPIKKSEEIQEEGFVQEEPRQYAPKERFEEKENNSRNYEARNIEHLKKSVPTNDSSVARDRFGRPFQSFDRRGRGRDFTNGPKRPIVANHRDAQNQRDDRGVTDQHHVVRSNSPKGRQQGRHNVPPHFEKRNSNPLSSQRRAPMSESPIVPPGLKSVAPVVNNSYEERIPHKPPSSYPTYEQPPRFSEEPSRGRITDTVDPAVRQMARKQDCPLDIRENIEFFHDTEREPSQRLQTILLRHCVYFLQRKSVKFPKARYLCDSCNYHMDTLTACLNHIMQERHSYFERMKIISGTLAMVPDPSVEHQSYLCDLLIKTSKLHGMNHTERMLRLDIVRRICEAIKERNLDCTATLFGSSSSGFGFRDCNVNINVNVGTDLSPLNLDNSNEQPSSPKTPLSTNNPAEFSEITAKLLGVIKQLPYVSEQKVKEVYTPKCVSIHFEEEKCRASCIIHFNNTSAVLAAQLFAEYDQLDPRVKPLVLCFRHWARVCDLDDQEKGFLPAHCYTIMVIHYLQKHTVLPILHTIPRIPSDKPFATAEEAKRCWSTQNTDQIGALWLSLLKYYAVEFSYKTRYISIAREACIIDKSEKQWNRKLCIEDPILPKSNLSRSVTNNKVCEYIIDRIKLAYLYFGVPRDDNAPLYEGIMGSDCANEDEIIKTIKQSSKPTSSQALQRMVRQIQGISLQGSSKGEEDWNIYEPPAAEVRMLMVCNKQQKQKFVLLEDVKKLHDILFKKEHNYEFKQNNFTDGSLPPIICKSCGAEGHLRKSCPEETVPPYLPVEYPTPLTLNRLNSAISLSYEQVALDSRDVNIRTRIVEEVKSILLPVYPYVCLTLFGSTFNGFGMHSSDVDICLTFSDVEIPPGERGIRLIDINSVLEKVVNALKLSGKMVDILSIPSAKVPIVKFRHIQYKLDGDVSLYNRLSIYNTELLRLYVDLDVRVARLGLFLKRLVKICDIGDASKGSLSSYGYILMLIHFLQNHSVPVLPVLQELQVPGHNSDRKFHCDSHIVEYCNDLNVVPAIWDGYGKNKESVSQLWLAFLNYYVEKFDNEKYVIAISQSAPITRVSKSWYSEGLAIEDPFDKSHNLGFGLTRRMSVHILKTLHKFRTFFHSATDPMKNELEYYLYPSNIREGNPPIDRQCRLCSRIGHFARNCTYTNKPEENNGNDESPQDIPPVVVEETRVPAIQNSVVREEKSSLPFRIRKEEPARVELAASNKPVEISPWPVDNVQSIVNPVVNGVMSPHMLNGLPAFNSNRKPFPTENEILGIPKFQNEPFPNVGEINQIRYNPRVDLETSKPDVQPVKEVVFFGDIGSPNADGEQIQAMLKKNEGVTFTFDLAHRPADAGNPDGMQTADIFTTHMGANVIRQPPPGYCPPSGMYFGNPPSAHTLPYMPEQGSRPIIPTPPGQQYNIAPMGMQIPPSVAYGHTPSGMSIPFQSVIPVGAVPYDGRSHANGENSDRSLVATATAPPPGFAPLPTGNNNCIHPAETIRTYPPQYAIPAVSVYSIAPVGITYQQLSTYSSAPSATAETSETAIGYRPLDAENDGGPVGTMSYDGNVMTGHPAANNNLAHQLPINNLTHMSNFQQHVMPVNVGMPNGQQIENGDDENNTTGYLKTTTVAGDMMYNSEYGGIIGGTPTASSYGLSLSQAHHGPVVSALQMQHSQHHPMQMQGGHFHHPSYASMRPFMPLGAFSGSPYSYPTMNVAHAIPHASDGSIVMSNQHGETGQATNIDVKQHLKQ